MTGAALPAGASCARITAGRTRQQGPGRGRPNALRASGLRERAWWLMRQVKRFTLDDLLLTLAEGHEADAPANLHKYVRQLERVGILKRLVRRQAGAALRSKGKVIWQLARDLGREAPVWRGAEKVVYDPNSGKLLPLLAAQSEADAAAACSEGGAL